MVDRQQFMRRFFADTFALVVFCTIAAGLVEWLVVGLTAGQMLYARLAAIPAIVCTARPYGFYRDWMFGILRALPGGGTGAAAIDIAAFITFQAPVYVAILLLAGADGRQILTAVPSAMVAMILCGRPYGIFLEWSRQLFRVTTGNLEGLR